MKPTTKLKINGYGKIVNHGTQLTKNPIILKDTTIYLVSYLYESTIYYFFETMINYLGYTDNEDMAQSITVIAEKENLSYRMFMILIDRPF
jgi:hypothetical protein